MTRSELIRLLQSTAASAETLHHVMHVWRDRVKKINIDTIMSYCARAIGVNVSDIKSKKRTQENVRARRLFVFVLHRDYYTMFSLNEIGAMLGGKNHASIIHHREKAYDLHRDKNEVFMIDLGNYDALVSGCEAFPIRKREKTTKGIPVINIESGKLYKSMVSAANDNRINIKTFQDKIRSKIKEDFPFRIAK